MRCKFQRSLKRRSRWLRSVRRSCWRRTFWQGTTCSSSFFAATRPASSTSGFSLIDTTWPGWGRPCSSRYSTIPHGVMSVAHGWRPATPSSPHCAHIFATTTSWSWHPIVLVARRPAACSRSRRVTVDRSARRRLHPIGVSSRQPHRWDADGATSTSSNRHAFRGGGTGSRRASRRKAHSRRRGLQGRTLAAAAAADLVHVRRPGSSQGSVRAPPGGCSAPRSRHGTTSTSPIGPCPSSPREYRARLRVREGRPPLGGHGRRPGDYCRRTPDWSTSLLVKAASSPWILPMTRSGSFRRSCGAGNAIDSGNAVACRGKSGPRIATDFYTFLQANGGQWHLKPQALPRTVLKVDVSRAILTFGRHSS